MSKANSNIRSMVEMQLHHPVDGNNYEGIHGLLNSAAKNHITSAIVSNKYVELAQFYNSEARFRESLELLLNGIQLSPTSNDIFNSLGESLSFYVTEYKAEFCDEDIRWLGTAIEYLESINYGPLGAQHQLDHNPGMHLLKITVQTLDVHHDGEVESVHTHFLSSISLKQYQNLTPEERKQKVSELFARKLLELEKAKKGKGEKSNA